MPGSSQEARVVLDLVNYEALSSELLRALRGKRSQPALSRRLGYRSNVVYTWESGRRFPSASSFFKLARRTGVDVDAAVMALVGDRLACSPDVGSSAGVAELLEALSADRTIVELAAAIDADRTTVARWLRGLTEPRLPDLLRYVQACTRRELEFVAAFTDPAELPSVRALHASLQAQRRLAYELPFSHAVLRVLELDGYRALPAHVPGFIAGQVGIDCAEEARCLAALQAAGQVRRDGAGRYVVDRVMTVDTRLDEVENRKLKAHWAQVGLERLRAARHGGDALLSYNLFAITEHDYQRIRRLHIEHFERIREIVGDSKRAERVVLMNLQLLPLADP